MLLRGMDFSEKMGKNSCVQGVEWKILKMFRIVTCIKSHLPWKFHEDPFGRFFRYVANRQTDRQTDKATDNDENYGSAEGPPRGVENRNLLSHPDDIRMEAYVTRMT